MILLGGIAWFVERRQRHDKSVNLESEIRKRGGRALHRLGTLVLTVEPETLLVTDPTRGLVLRSQSWTTTVTASVETAGSISVTRGRNLAKKAIGGALVPGGVFLFGNARETAHDHRELYLVVESETWAEVLALDPNLGAEARRFVQQINLAARGDRVPTADAPRQTPSRHPVKPSATPATPSATSETIDRLERLAKLHESGALTKDEFERQKASLLQP